MALRRSEEYKASLGDGRAVFHRGERVEDVANHPHLKLAVEHTAIDCRIAEEPEYRELATVELPGGGGYQSVLPWWAQRC